MARRRHPGEETWLQIATKMETKQWLATEKREAIASDPKVTMRYLNFNKVSELLKIPRMDKIWYYDILEMWLN